MEDNMDCTCPTYNEVVFPKVDVGHIPTFRLGNNERRFKQLHVKKPKNFVFKGASIESLKGLKRLFEDGYITSIKQRFIDNFFLTNTIDMKKVQEENSTLYHQMYSLLDEYIELIEKVSSDKKNKRQRYRRNKAHRERSEKENWNSEPTNNIERTLYKIEISRSNSSEKLY
jgi:hypothetical protein